MRYLPWIFSLIILIIIINDGCAIINGKLTRRSQFPYSVVLTLTKAKGNCLLCSGAIISEKHVLTAAHCFYCVDTPNQIEVVVSESFITKNDFAVKVKQFDRHPHYESSDDRAVESCCDYLLHCLRWPRDLKQKNDIAVATLMQSLRLGGTVNRVFLPEPDLSCYPKVCDFTGWGKSRLSMTKKQSDDEEPSLHWTQLSILKPKACKKVGSYVVTNDILCAEDLSGRSYPFSGDSGGPLVHDNVVYGVYSGRATKSNRPSLFFKVSNYLEFINKIVQKT